MYEMSTDWTAYPLPLSGGPMTNVSDNVVGPAFGAANTVNVQAPPYVVKVSGKRKDGQYFYGTGFILTGNGLVATCSDVIKDAAGDILVKLPTQEEPWICHVKEVDKDLALLRVLRADDSVKPSSTSVANLDPDWVKGNVRDEAITCYCWGSSNLDSPDDPQRINGKFSNFDRGLIFLDLDAKVNLADSGAPVLNANNKVIGIVNYCQTKVVGSAVARTVNWFVRIKREQHEGLESIDTSAQFHTLLTAISDAKGDFVLFIGSGISFSLYKHLAQYLASLKYFTEKSIRIQDLVGVPCLTCHHSAGPNTPRECPLLKDIAYIEREEDCPLYREQLLAVTMANIRVFSQYAIAESHSTVNLYNDLFHSLNLYLHSDVDLDLLTTNKCIARSISMYMIPLIITTNLDNTLEKALKDQNIGFHRIIFDPSWKGNEQNAFVHKISGEIKEIESGAKWPTQKTGDNIVIILKLCGTYEHKGDQPFILASEHHDRLVHCISAKKLPSIIIEKLRKATTLFIGHSPNDPELQQILEAILATIGPTKFRGKSYFIHQCKPGFLDESFYKDIFPHITFVGLRDDLKRILEVINT